MEFDDVIRSRRSIRGYLDKPVPKALVREILELRQGSVIPLDKMAGETTDVCVNGIPMAKGEVVIIADSIHIRVAEILGAADHEKDSYQDET